MTLKELIDFLEERDPSIIVPVGFANPHSYRGYYERLAFEPKDHTTIGEMLAAAKSALNETFDGYKGGEYIMSEDVECYLADLGCTGESIGPILLCYMAGEL